MKSTIHISSRWQLAWMLLLLTYLTTHAQDKAQEKIYARIAVLRPNNGQTVEFEAGYIRHLDWHKQAADTWKWYGWTVWAGERQRWFIYATFGHTATSLDNPVSPAEDEKDNVLNVVPHCEFVGNTLYEFLPKLSRGNGTPQPTPRIEFVTIDLKPGTEVAFEAAIIAEQSRLKQETLWYKLIAGGNVPRYVRMRAQPSLSGILGNSESVIPKSVTDLTTKTTIEILALKPSMSYGISMTSDE